MGGIASAVGSRWRIDGAFAKTVEAEMSLIPVDSKEDAKYYALPIKRVFKGGIRASQVSLLENGLVKKQYKLKHEAGRRLFWHEVGILRKLKDCQYAPTMKHFDRLKGIIYMTYCGEPQSNSENVQARIKEQLSEMKTKWGVHFKGTFHPRYGNANTEGLLNNITSLGNHLYFIDFGSAAWFYAPQQTTQPPTLNTTSSFIASKNKNKSTVVKNKPKIQLKPQGEPTIITFSPATVAHTSPTPPTPPTPPVDPEKKRPKHDKSRKVIISKPMFKKTS